VQNLVNTTTGAPLATTPAGNGTVPQAELDTLANILASCVNSNGVSSTCASLQAASTPAGGTAPTNVLQAIYNIAMNPSSQVAALYALASATVPYQPTLTSTPNDWTVGLNYTGSGLSSPQTMAIDGSGNVWIANNGNAVNTSSVTELSSNGTVLSGSGGYTGGAMSFATSIAIDPSGNAWVAAYGNSNVIKLSSGGAILSGSSGFTAGGSTSPGSIAIDSAGDAWVANSNDYTITELSNSGAVLSGTTGYYLGGLVHPGSIAIDASGDAWFMNPFVNAAFEMSSSGSLLTPAAGRATCISPPPPNPGRQCDTSFSFPLAIDGSGNIWAGTANDILNSNGIITSRIFGLTELNVSGSGAYIVGLVGSAYVGGIAIDASGDVWTDNDSANSVTEVIGIATPVVTPLSVGVLNHMLGSRP
jgi:hypothetical protein